MSADLKNPKKRRKGSNPDLVVRNSFLSKIKSSIPGMSPKIENAAAVEISVQYIESMQKNLGSDKAKEFERFLSEKMKAEAEAFSLSAKKHNAKKKAEDEASQKSENNDVGFQLFVSSFSFLFVVNFFLVHVYIFKEDVTNVKKEKAKEAFEKAKLHLKAKKSDEYARLKSEAED